MQKTNDINFVSSAENAVALGYFDGIHTAHRKILEEMACLADSHSLEKRVFTFYRDIPLQSKGMDIFSPQDREKAMEDMGIDLYFCPPFSSFNALSCEEFVQNVLAVSLKAKAVFCGDNFFFGKGRRGDVNTLGFLCKKYNIEFFPVKTLYSGNAPISSTRIRKALELGDIEEANSLLGFPYSVNFEVIHGKKLGKKMGTPTINQVFPQDMTSPAEGVYITSAELNGRVYPAATGLSRRPTVERQGERTCETYIKGFDGDLYGRKVRVKFYRFLHPIQKYPDLSRLGKMISESADESEKYLSEIGILK